MKNLKRLTAALLCMTFAMSMCSCSESEKEEDNADREENVTEAAKTVSDLVISRDYQGLCDKSDKTDDNLEGLMDSCSLSDSSYDILKAYTAIADTLDYEVKDDSFEYDEDSGISQIDVEFTYVDIEDALTDGSVFMEFSSFTDYLEECEGKISVTVSLSFADEDDGDYVLLNISDIDPVFDFCSYEISFAQEPSVYVSGGVIFEGDAYDPSSNTYTDTNGIYAELEVMNVDGFTWNYRYTVENDGEVIYESDLMVDFGTEYLAASYTSDEEVIPSGEYIVNYYDNDGQLLGFGSVTVISSEDSDDDLGFYCPEGNSTVLPGTNIRVTIPDEMTFREENYEGLPFITSLDCASLYLWADISLDDLHRVHVYYVPGNSGVTKEDVYQCGESFSQSICISYCRSIGSFAPDYVTYDTELTLGEDTFIVRMIDYEDSEGHRTDALIGLGDGDTCYFVEVNASSTEEAEQIISSMFSLES